METREKSSGDQRGAIESFPDSTPSFETVCRWIREGGKNSAGRRSSLWPPSDIRDRSLPRAVIDKDPTVTLRFLSLEFGVSHGSGHDIVNEHLGLRKKCARWIPRLLT